MLGVFEKLHSEKMQVKSKKENKPLIINQIVMDVDMDVGHSDISSIIAVQIS